MKQEHDKAISDFTEAIRLDPDAPEIYTARGMAYTAKQDYDKAITDFTEAIRFDTSHRRAYYGRGFAHQHNKEYDKAIPDYEEAIRLDPSNPQICNSIAWLLATCPKDGLRDGKKAVKYATLANELSNGDNAKYLDTLADAYAEYGDFKEAVNWQKKALEVGVADKEWAERAKMRLKLYEDGKACRDR